MKYQIAKLYRGEHFSGFGIAVNGKLLDGQLNITINTEPGSIPTATVVFYLDKDNAENQIAINLEEPNIRINFESKPSDEMIDILKKAASEGAERGYRNAVKHVSGNLR
ncbi:TPA: hypothetical protein ACJI3N_000658 [Raoultella planticola]